MLYYIPNTKIHIALDVDPASTDIIEVMQLNLVRINKVVEKFGLSSRTLRYYEERGLIWSYHPENKPQRYYDDPALERLRQIIILRKLQIPIKEMLLIFESESMTVMIGAFVSKLESLDVEIAALSELRKLVDEFLQKVIESDTKKIESITSLYEATEHSLTTAQTDDSISFDELSKISREALKLHDIRIIRLPAMRMLISRLKTGQIVELDADKMQHLFSEYGLTPTPGLRDCFFLNEQTNKWLMMMKVADDFENDTEYEDNHFSGGLYAVTSAFFEDMEDTFILLKDWITQSEDYELDVDENNVPLRSEMIEEILPWDIALKFNRFQQDIFIPIKIREELN